jgi:DNA-nicking Smr family endonuclease
MPRPQLNDDGVTVTLDLHGATVDEAVALALRTFHLAQRRGRATLKLIHGASTSAPGRRTIRSALHALDDAGRFAAATHVRRARGHLVLSLDLTAPRSPQRLRLRDVM